MGGKRATRVDGLLVERCEGELVVFVSATNEAHALNETASLIFEMCDGETSRAEMVAALERAGLPADEAIVDLALADLEEASLIVTGDATRKGLTRRVVIRRLGLSGAAIATLPVVDTIFVQSAAAATSFPTSTTTTTMTTTFFTTPTTTTTTTTTSTTTTTTATTTTTTTPTTTTTTTMTTTPA
jgi:hypothetical protein